MILTLQFKKKKINTELTHSLQLIKPKSQANFDWESHELFLSQNHTTTPLVRSLMLQRPLVSPPPSLSPKTPPRPTPAPAHTLRSTHSTRASCGRGTVTGWRRRNESRPSGTRSHAGCSRRSGRRRRRGSRGGYGRSRRSWNCACQHASGSSGPVGRCRCFPGTWAPHTLPTIHRRRWRMHNSGFDH